ncbi:COP9 signalosome complex subunit 8 [Chelonus insularis]|uniref:COP9 signalosome complex subunit 8 n=1 Tax=Chelonus insularis TaxID=460826 RepID=UPI00158ADDEB|nr:COP9 signalosome complex subunit 8 [Chelonus insularis]
MVLGEVNTLVQELEKAELEAPDGLPSAQIYAQLLAVYLYQNDLCNAKYLWKRIPPNIKSLCPELQQIWMVGQRMWQRDWRAVHAALNNEWSDDVNSIMHALKENVRERAMILISEAYSSVNLSVLAAMTGLSLEQAQISAVERGWTVDGNTVKPCKVDKEQHTAQATLTEDQLYKLTEFVSFLEN